MAQLNQIAQLHRVAVGISLGLAWLSFCTDAWAQAAPQRMANPYYASVPAAANAGATLVEPKVVYPAITTNPVHAKGLPRDRAAALRAAVSVATLDDAYRAGVAASEAVMPGRAMENSPYSNLSQRSTHEPRRFKPDAGTARISTQTNVAASNFATANAGSPNVGSSTTSARRDAAVQQVVWMSDDTSTPSPHAAASNRIAVQPQQLDVGNPLRRDVTSLSGNPLR